MNLFRIELASAGVDFFPSTRFKVRPFLDQIICDIHISPYTKERHIIFRERYDYYRIIIKDITIDEWINVFEKIRNQTIVFTPFYDITPTDYFNAIVEVCEHNYIGGKYYADAVELRIKRSVYKYIST